MRIRKSELIILYQLILNNFKCKRPMSVQHACCKPKYLSSTAIRFNDIRIKEFEFEFCFKHFKGFKQYTIGPILSACK